MTKRIVAVVCLIGAVALFYQFVFRGLYYTPASVERSDVKHNWLQQGFSVALVWPTHHEPSLVEGVTMALEEVNAGGGPLAGKIKLRNFVETDDDGAVARRVVAYHDVLAIIGHEIGGTAIPASLTYEKHGVLFLAAKASDIRLTDHEFHYVFRLTLDDTAYTDAIAHFAVDQNWKRVGVLFGRSDHGEDASSEFLTSAKELDIKIPIVQSFFHDPDASREDFRPMLADVRRNAFDALMLADELPWAGKLLQDMRAMGLTEPVIATDKLDTRDTWAAMGSTGDSLYVASAVDPDSTIPAYVSFRDRFRKRFGVEPSYGAVQGYDSFMLYVNAIIQSKSADPLVVATTLRTNKWNGLFGDVFFEPNGEVTGRVVSIEHLLNGVFHTVAIEKDVK